ncbi:MAG: endonuclease [Firmicutes bacterium]|nr:endonuclease [Candidatus Fiminaster equi]
MRLFRTVSVISTAIVSFCCTACGVDESTLYKIAVTKAPDKISYVAGEKFDPKGMEVTGYYAEDKTKEIEDYTYTPTKALSTSNKTVTITYKGFKCTTKISVSIAPKPDPEGYYKECEGLQGSQLEDKLKEINTPRSPSYDWKRYEAADESATDPSCILSLYTRHDIPKNNHCGNYAWNYWNREHIWTQTAYPNSKQDNHNIFACEGQINAYRGDLPFGEVSHTSGNTKKIFGHDVDCYWTSSRFEPCDDAKGEVARAVMYGTVQYSYDITDMISIDLALKWHLEHPITTRDQNRNSVVYTLQGNRNPFVDHPEYACKIWGTTNSATKKICGM